MNDKKLAMFDLALLKPAVVDSFKKLNPAVQWRNPVMFVVYVGSILTTILWLQALQGEGEASSGFILAVGLWLWFTVLFANFAEALAEGRSKAQAASLRGLKKSTFAKKLNTRFVHGTPISALQCQVAEANSLRKGDYILIEADDVIAADGEVVEILETLGVESQCSMHHVVEVAADAGALQTAGFSLQVEHLAEHSRLPEALAVKPWTCRVDVVEACQHGQHKDRIGGNVLVAGSGGGERTHIERRQQVQRQVRGAVRNALPQPVSTHCSAQLTEHSRRSRHAVDAGLQAVHAVHKHNRVHARFFVQK